ncbi:alpha/beta fold hydrolase [Streptomyces sp. NPDC048362]|uniref:alpha/beta fold hydrolase n=1 Tax=Streptomyces sp. NPDC048362 TaxID=3365539 RepID=UPI00371911A8
MIRCALFIGERDPGNSACRKPGRQPLLEGIDVPVADTRHGPIEHVVIDGDPSRSPLVFLHGGLGCVASWGRFPAAVAAATGRRALVYSRPGNGGSGPATSPHTPRYMHEQGQRFLPELLDLLGIHDPVLIGHSDGASTALLYASVRPAEAVVVIGPHLYFEEANRTGIEAARRLRGRTAAPQARPGPRRPARRVHELERAVALRRVPDLVHRERPGRHRAGPHGPGRP